MSHGGTCVRAHEGEEHGQEQGRPWWGMDAQAGMRRFTMWGGEALPSTMGSQESKQGINRAEGGQRHVKPPEQAL